MLEHIVTGNAGAVDPEARFAINRQTENSF